MLKSQREMNVHIHVTMIKGIRVGRFILRGTAAALRGSMITNNIHTKYKLHTKNFSFKVPT